MKSLPTTNGNDLDLYYIPPSSTCWTGRDDEPNSRLFQQIQALDCRNLPSSQSESSIRLLSKLAYADEVQGVDGAEKLSVQKLRGASGVDISLPSLRDAVEIDEARRMKSFDEGLYVSYRSSQNSSPTQHSSSLPQVIVEGNETIRSNTGATQQFAAEVELGKKSIALLGFSCDEGVRRNQGRLGAAQGPESLRKALRNLPLPPDKIASIWDAGTVVCGDEDLETAQQVLGELVSQLRQRGAFVVVLGGGHEVAWGHFQGLIDSTGLDVVNFDAHFDLRPLLSGGKGSSGTCFRQMHTMCQEKKTPWRYACLGIQPFGNTNSLFDYAASIGTYHCLAEAMVYQPERVHEALATWLSSAHRIYLTLCLDVFAAAYAPGVSAPQAMGLSPQTLLPFFRQVLQSGKVIGFDIAELNPTYDRDDQTASLAAYFVAEVCYQCHCISAK